MLLVVYLLRVADVEVDGRVRRQARHEERARVDDLRVPSRVPRGAGEPVAGLPTDPVAKRRLFMLF